MGGCIVKPSRTADQLRRAEIAQIHIAKSQLGMDDDTYRAMLWSVGRVRSSSELDWRGRKAVLDHLKRSGFKVQAKPQSRRLDLDAESRKARAIWLLLAATGELRDTSEKALAAFVKRLVGVDDLRFTTGAQVTTVIESLKKWCVRVWIKRLEAAGHPDFQHLDGIDPPSFRIVQRAWDRAQKANEAA